MAISITKGQMEENEEKTCSEPMFSQRAGESTEPIPFHLHCQKTVCSAQGQNGNGATWDVINNNVFTNLPSQWKDYFIGNGNITEDLRGILRLINQIAGTIITAKTWDLVFKANNGNIITQKTIAPWLNNGGTYEFNGFGRTITLKIDGATTSFNTMVGGDETYNINLERNNLTINFNGKSVGTMNDIAAPNDTDINIQQDYNTINMGGVAHQSSISTLKLNQNQHAYRVYMYYQPSIPLLKVNLSNYYSASQTLANGKPDEIVEFELHMINNQGEVSRSVTAPPSGKQPSEFEDEAYVTPSIVWRSTNVDGSPFSKVERGIEINALTDKLTVDAHTANVYIVRLDFQRWIVTYSLAYTYPFNS